MLACYELGSFLHVAESCTVSEWPQDMITNAHMQQYMFDILCSRVPVRLCAVLHQLSPGNGMHAWRSLCEWFYTSAPHELGACDGSSLSRAPASAWERNTPCEAPSDKMQLLADDRMLLHLDECTEQGDVTESMHECVHVSDVPESTNACVLDCDVAGSTNTCVLASYVGEGPHTCVYDSVVAESTDACVPDSECCPVLPACSSSEHGIHASPHLLQRLLCDSQPIKLHVGLPMRVPDKGMHHVDASKQVLGMHALYPFAVKHFFTTALQTG